MGRPSKNNCDYFPHFTTMHSHRKVMALRVRFGMVLGYAFWSMFMEYLTEQDGNELENSDLELEMFSVALGIDYEKVREMINYCLKIELLFVNKDNFLYSESLNEKLTPVFDQRKRAKEISKTRQRRENGTFIPHVDPMPGISMIETPQEPELPLITTIESPQIEEKRSKENESKENKIINKHCETSSHLILKNYFLDFYERKHGALYQEWGGMEAKALNQLIKKMKNFHVQQKLDISPQAVEEGVMLLFEEITNEWLLANMSVAKVNAQFSNITSQLIKQKNGKSTAKNTAGISDTYIRNLKERLHGKQVPSPI